MNQNLIVQLENLIFYLQDNKENKYRILVFQKTVKKIKELKVEIKSGNHLFELAPDNIGSGVISRVDEIIKTGKLKEVKYDIIAIKQLQQVHGIGPAKAKKYVDEYKIVDLDDFKRKIERKEIEITDNSIALGLKHYHDSLLKISRTEIKTIEKFIKKECSNALQFVITGSYRRGKTTSGDIDMLLYQPHLCTFDEEGKLQALFYNLLRKLTEKKVIVDNLTKIEETSMKYMGYINPAVINAKYKVIRRLDMRIVPYNSFHTALLYFTGSGSFNQHMRSIAKHKNMILNEYGLYPVTAHDKYKDKGFQINSEKDVFDRLDMEYLRPDERDGEF